MKALPLSVWRFRHFILSGIGRELKMRFARSKLGALWFILHPLAQSAIFALVLSEVLGTRLGHMTDKAAYPIYLMSGMAAWGLFSEIVNRCLNVFMEYAPALKKIAFPRISLPLIVWGSALVTHCLLLAAMAIVFVFLGHYPSVTWLGVVLGIVLISTFAFGLGIFLGVFNVFARDIAQVMSVVMQLWFWLTPIVYAADSLPPKLQHILALNPMVALVRIYQDALFLNQWPDLSSLGISTAIALGLSAMSFLLFRRASPELVDAL